MKLFEVTRDTELWVVRGNDRRLPVLVKPGITTDDSKEAWLITNAVALDADQLDWLKEMLNTITKARYNGAWLARPARAKMVMDKAPGITPAYYVQWGQMTKPVTVNQQVPNDDISTVSDAFMRYACNQCGMESTSQAGYYWVQFCRAAMNWVLIERQPLDLMFARVHAVPYRRNWLAILANKFPHYLTIASESPEERERQLNSTTFNWICEQPDLIAMQSPGQVEWSLEIEMRDSWRDHSRKWEERCLAQMGPHEYYQRWQKLVRSSFRWIRSIFHDYFTASSWAIAEVDRSSPVHSRFLRWLLEGGRVRVAPSAIPESHYINGHSPPENDTRKRTSAEKAFANLPEVPDEDYSARLVDLWKPGRVDQAGR